MNERITALIAATDVDVDMVARAVPADGDIELVGVVDALGEAWRAIEDNTADVLVVACSGYSERALGLIQDCARARPSRPVVVLAEGPPAGFVRRIFEAGADDIVALPESSQVVHFTLHKAVARKRRGGTAASSSLARLVCVLGPKGGTGKTLTATNLAVSMAQKGRKVVLVDIDLQFGDVGLSLGLPPERTIFDLARSAGSLDAEKIEAYLVPHDSGVRALLAPSRPDQASAVTADLLRELYGVLRQSNDAVVVDTPPGFSAEVIATIDSASDVVMVGMLDALSLKNTKLGLETLELMGFDAGRVRIVLNRADSRVGIGVDDVVAVLGRMPDTLVPSDREIPRALSASSPIVKARAHSEAARALAALAGEYVASNGNGAGHHNGSRPLRRLLGRTA